MNYLSAGLLPGEPGIYPTKEEILAERPKFRWGVFKAISDWKTAHYRGWAARGDEERFEACQALVNAICSVYGVPKAVISQWDDRVDAYRDGIITLTKPSIITALHELGHHLFGPSELHACRFSVWIYQLRFSTALTKLVWNGHLLQEPPSQESVRS